MADITPIALTDDDLHGQDLVRGKQVQAINGAASGSIDLRLRLAAAPVEGYCVLTTVRGGLMTGFLGTDKIIGDLRTDILYEARGYLHDNSEPPQILTDIAAT